MKTEERSAQARFGMFDGVFTSSVLAILGVIMFMRAGYVVGEAGLGRALLVLAIAKIITTLTSLSLSAIATNTEVRTGGVYYMVSRAMGPDFGGAIGLTLFLSQAVSIAFYAIGFSEALHSVIAPPGSELAATLAPYQFEPLVSTGMICLLFLLTFWGNDLVLRARYAILAVLMLSVAAFLLGGLISLDPDQLRANLGAHLERKVDIWVVFAIFFPAATGITTGANMAARLKEPADSIPRGTLYAIGFTALIYLAELVLLAGYTDRSTLILAPFESLAGMSLFAPLVIAGVFVATLSSALGCFQDAPRIMQAMGRDRLLAPLEFFGQGSGPGDQPRRAALLIMAIAVAVVWIGDLDAVAPVISMLFLVTYAMINLAAFVESRAGNPSFRPRFQLFGWPVALAGVIASAIAMVKIDETYAIIIIGIAVITYFWLRGRITTDWGDARRGYIFSRTRQNLLMLENTAPDPKNWRPVLMVLTESAERERQLLQAAAWIESGRGLLSVLEVSSEPGLDVPGRLGARQEHVARIRQHLRSRGLVALADSVVVPDAEAALDAVIQAYSIGSLRPNTVMMSIPPPTLPERREHVARLLARVASFGLNVVLYKGAKPQSGPKKLIDVWWHGQRNGSLLALFAYLAQCHPDWSKAQIRMLRVVKDMREHMEAESSLSEMMRAARLAVHVQVVLSTKPVSEVIAEQSGKADLVLLGLRQIDVADLPSFLAARDELLTRLPPTLLVLSNGEADLLA